MPDKKARGAAGAAINVVWCPDCRQVIAAGRTTGGSHRHEDGTVHVGRVVQGVQAPPQPGSGAPKALAAWMDGLSEHIPRAAGA